MIADVPLWAVLLIAAVVAVGAFVQATIGLDLGLLGAPGTVLGVWLTTAFSERGLGIVVGIMVLGAVWLTFHTVEVPQTPVTLIGAGLAAVLLVKSVLG